MKIVYLITKILTYPGAFLKGFWEHLTCRILKLQVTERRYLRPDETCGHAAHAPAMTPAKAFLFSWMPYLAQHMLGFIFLGASVPSLLIFGMRDLEQNPLAVVQYAALFLGLSIICNSFPQWEDAKRHWRLFYGAPTPAEEQAMREYSEALMEAFDAVPAPVEDEDAIAVEEAVAEEEVIASEEPAEVIPPALPEMPELPRFAGLAGKIILAPANAYFLAGAWLEKYGITTIAAIAITIAVLLLR